jgi:signal peptidase I
MVRGTKFYVASRESERVAKIEVYLAINQPDTQERVQAVLEDSPDIEIIGEAPDDLTLFPPAEGGAPMVAVLDAGPGLDSLLNVTRRVREETPATAMILVTDNGNDEEAFTALICGVNACLTHRILPGQLADAIRDVAYGESPIIRSLLRPDVASRALEEFYRPAATGSEADWPHLQLSFQQRTLLRYIENKHTLPQLVLNLGMSQGGIREQLERIRVKLTDLGDYLQPVPDPMPNLEIQAETGAEEAEPEPAAEIKQDVHSPVKQFFTEKIALLRTPFLRRLFKSIFRLSPSRVIILIIILIIGFFLSIHLLPGYNLYVVNSESMSPTINVGDITVTRTLDSQSKGELEPGDIVTFQHGSGTVTHRLLSINGSELITKGDAAEESDPWPISLEEVKDVYLFRIPYLGYIPHLAKDKLGWFLMIVLPAVLLVALLVRDIIKEALRSDKAVTEKQGGDFADSSVIKTQETS